jgi:hypothetical protein
VNSKVVDTTEEKKNTSEVNDNVTQIQAHGKTHQRVSLKGADTKNTTEARNVIMKKVAQDKTDFGLWLETSLEVQDQALALTVVVEVTTEDTSMECVDTEIMIAVTAAVAKEEAMDAPNTKINLERGLMNLTT